MAAEIHDIELCQGSVFTLEQVLRDEITLMGADLTTGPAVLRMTIREPDRNATTAVLTLTQTPTALGSEITLTAEEEIPATSVTTFAASGVTTVTGAGFTTTVPTVTELDEDTGDPLGVQLTTLNVAKIADLAVIAGSTSNDGNYRLSKVTDADTVTLLPNPAVEAAAGTLQVLRQGRFTVTITAEDTDAMDFEEGEYDLEWVSAPGVQPIRILQGAVTFDKNVTR